MKKKTASKQSVTTQSTSGQTVTVVVEEQKSGHPVVSVFTNFTTFLREQGVIGLAIAVVLGGAVSKLVAALVSDLINPIVGVLVGAAGDLASMTWKVGPIKILWGHFVATMIDFVIVASVIYLLVKMLKLDRLDKKKA